MAAQPIHLSFVWFANQYIRQDVPDLSCAGRAVAKRPFLKFDFPPVAFGNLVDVADSDFDLLGRRNSRLIRGKILKLNALRD